MGSLVRSIEWGAGHALPAVEKGLTLTATWKENALETTTTTTMMMTMTTCERAGERASE